MIDILFCTDRLTTPNVDAAPFQTYLTKEWKGFQEPRVNSYTANQSPLLEGETLSRATYCSKTLPGFTRLL